MDASALASIHSGITQKNNLAKKYSSTISQFAEVSSRITRAFSFKHVHAIDSRPLERAQLNCANQLFSYLFIRSSAPRANRIQSYIKS